MNTGDDRAHVPGDIVLRPAVVSCLAVLVLNDHALKDRWPGWVTGKASDAVGLYAFPLVVLGVAEVALWAGRRTTHAVPHRWFAAIVVAVGAGFAAIKLSQPAGDLYQVGLGTLRWLPGAAIDALAGSAPGARGRAALVRDPTDLATLVVLWPAWRAGLTRGR